jgi:hypothetical protein
MLVHDTAGVSAVPCKIEAASGDAMPELIHSKKTARTPPKKISFFFICCYNIKK